MSVRLLARSVRVDISVRIVCEVLKEVLLHGSGDMVEGAIHGLGLDLATVTNRDMFGQFYDNLRLLDRPDAIMALERFYGQKIEQLAQLAHISPTGPANLDDENDQELRGPVGGTGPTGPVGFIGPVGGTGPAGIVHPPGH